MDEQYYDIERRTAVKESARELRRKFLRYKDAEIVYSMTHKKLLELAGKAGAIYRIDGYVLLRILLQSSLRRKRKDERSTSDENKEHQETPNSVYSVYSDRSFCYKFG